MNPSLKKNHSLKFNPGTKMKILFITGRGDTNNTFVNYGTTINQLLKYYLEIKNVEYLYGDNTRIGFIYGGVRLKFGDDTPVEKFFEIDLNPSVIVIQPRLIISDGFFIYPKVYSHFEELYKKLKLFLDPEW